MIHRLRIWFYEKISKIKMLEKKKCPRGSKHTNLSNSALLTYYSHSHRFKHKNIYCRYHRMKWICNKKCGQSSHYSNEFKIDSGLILPLFHMKCKMYMALLFFHCVVH